VDSVERKKKDKQMNEIGEKRRSKKKWVRQEGIWQRKDITGAYDWQRCHHPTREKAENAEITKKCRWLFIHMQEKSPSYRKKKLVSINKRLRVVWWYRESEMKGWYATYK
jgi:hypothetical protein